MDTLINSKIKSIIGFCTVSIFVIIQACNSTTNENKSSQEVVPEAVLNSDCPKPLSWLTKDPIPEPNYLTFPCGYTVDDKGAVTNRAFHEISWQYFLWLTEEIEVNNQKMLRFESMFNDASISLEANDPNGRSHILGGIQQAGSNSVLVDENGRAVYTSMMIDDIYYKFVRDNQLYNPEVLKAFDPETNFANGSMSMKAAWKIIPEGQSAPKGAYTRKSTLYKVVKIDGNLTTSDNYKDKAKRETIEETVVLVGFHIAVVVDKHPEFIWATFEYNDNAPSYILKNETIGTGVPSDENKTFYAKGTELGNCNVSNLKALEVDPVTQIITGAYGVDATTQVYRRYEYGAGSSTNQDNIEELNDQVHNALDPNSMWQNYGEVGAVWFNLDNGHLVPNWSLTVDPKLQTGSLTLSNSVIETFTQDLNQQPSCFSCHNTMKQSIDGAIIDGKNVLTSHILLKNYINAIILGETVITVDRTE